MIDIQVILLLTSLILFIMAYILFTNKNRNFSRHFPALPLGPRGLPFIGNIFQLTRNTPLTLSSWTEKYGKLYTINIGYGNPALVVSCPAMMNKIFGKQAATGKFRSELMDILYGGHFGVGNSEGSVWKEQHTFCARVLRKFGLVNNAQVESMVLTELHNLCESILEEMCLMDGTIYLHEILKKTTTKIIWSIITGENNVSTDILCHLLDKWRNAIQVASKSGLGFFSWMKYLAPVWSGYKGYVEAVNDIHEFLEAQFRKHTKIENKSGLKQQANNIISAYLVHTENMRDKVSSFSGNLGYHHSFHSVLALLIGGAETTALALNWILFYLTAHPHVQNRVQHEIKQVVGESRYPNLKDKSRMPYTQAVIQESFRLSSLAPLGVTHRLIEEVNFQNYRLPEGLLLIPNIYHVHNDPEIWRDPQNFRPERFLKAEALHNPGKSQERVLRDSVVCFQPGKRKCVGEPMARDLIFLCVTSLLTVFSFSADERRLKSEYLEPEIGWFMIPKQIPVVVSQHTKCIEVTAEPSFSP